MTKPPPALPPVRSVYPMNHRRRMTDAEVNHLRRLLGYVRCEIGQAPDEMRDMLVSIAAKLGPVTDPAAQERVIEGMEHSLRVPEYIRAAVKSLARPDVAPEAGPRRAPLEGHLGAAGRRAAAVGDRRDAHGGGVPCGGAAVKHIRGHLIPYHLYVVPSLEMVHIFRSARNMSRALPRRVRQDRQCRILKPKRRPWAWAFRFWYGEKYR